MKKVYVSMTDKFMSGWGQAKGMTNKLVISCDDWTEANIVKQNAESRSEMKYINICINKPYYGKNVLVSTGDKLSHANWFKPGYFNRQTA